MQIVVEKMYEMLDKIIDFEEHEQRRMDRVHKPEADCNQDFVDLLLPMPSLDKVETLDHETILGVVMNILFAGTETQASTLEWAMVYLLQHPEVMQRAQVELDSVVGTQRIVQASDLEHLPYLEAVMKEVSRVQPGVPIAITHESLEETQVAGYNLPARTRLLFNIYAIHRDPNVYNRPDEFDPSRFLKPHGGSHDSYQLRICPGMPLADITMAHTLAHLLHSFTWRLPGDQKSEELDMTTSLDGVTAPTLHPLLTVAQPRPQAFLY